MRTRRLWRFALVVGAALGALWPVTEGAQPAERVRQIAVLAQGTGLSPEPVVRVLDFEAGCVSEAG